MTTTALDLLKEHEDTLLKIKQRYYFLQAFETVLSDRTKGHRFEIPNGTVYQCAFDCYDMLAIDLASLCRGMIGRGGLADVSNHKDGENRLFQHPEAPDFLTPVPTY